MGELVFIGLGLFDEMGLSLRGQAEAKACGHIFAELYTSVMPGLKIGNLEQIVGRPVRVLSRVEVEENAESIILSKAKVGRVGFLVAGDPMVATTHVDLRLRAHRAGIVTRIIHAASVAAAAAGATGLQSYKFGRTVTVPVSRVEGLSESVYMGIRGNLESGLHSLVLLEVDVENGRHITISQALEQLLALSAQTPDRLIKLETLVVAVARLDAHDMMVKAGTVSEVARMDFGGPPYCLIFPGPLHFVEMEALQVFCGARKDLVARGMRGRDENPWARAQKYIEKLAMTFQQTTARTEDTSVRGVNVSKVSDAIERYLQDARHYLERGEGTTSLAAVAYAEGLLDALTFLELAQERTGQ